MKTYIITENTEPLREGCLTQYGVVRRYTNKGPYGCRMINGSHNLTEAKHLKCYEEVSCHCYDIGYPVGGTKRKAEITDPKQLQQIWEAIRGEEVNSQFEYVDKTELYSWKEWQNFTLKEGTYQVGGVYDMSDWTDEERGNLNQIVEDCIGFDAKVLPDNNGWIRTENKSPEDYEAIFISDGRNVECGMYANGRYYDGVDGREKKDTSHWQPLPKPPRH